MLCARMKSPDGEEAGFSCTTDPGGRTRKSAKKRGVSGKKANYDPDRIHVNRQAGIDKHRDI
jgi:hypothetical protein